MIPPAPSESDAPKLADRPAEVPLALQGVSVSYQVIHGDESDAVLFDATVAFKSGAMTAIIGPNGAGKSTLLHAALGLVPTLCGEVTFFGQPFEKVRARVAFLPQRESVDWDFPITVLDVVRMGATSGLGWWIPPFIKRLVGGTGENDRTREALARVGMEDFAKRPIGDLSGGQQQRVFLARALAQNADVVLLDEPFAGVDAATEELLLNELKALAQGGRTVIAVHHDLDTVALHFDEAVLIQRTIQKVGPAREVLGSPAALRIFGPRAVQAG